MLDDHVLTPLHAILPEVFSQPRAMQGPTKLWGGHRLAPGGQAAGRPGCAPRATRVTVILSKGPAAPSQPAPLPLKQMFLDMHLFFVVVVVFGFFWPCRVACGILVPRPGIELGPSAVKTQSPNHWTSREFPWTPISDSKESFPFSGSYYRMCPAKRVGRNKTPLTKIKDAPPFPKRKETSPTTTTEQRTALTQAQGREGIRPQIGRAHV